MKLMESEGVEIGLDDLGIVLPGSSDERDHEQKMHKIAREYLDQSGVISLIIEIFESKPGEFVLEELSWDELASTNSTDDTLPQHPGNPFSIGLLISWDEKTKWENNMGTALYSGIIIEAKVNGEIEVKGDILLPTTILQVNSSTQEKNEAIERAFHSPYLYERPIAGANEYGGGWLIA